MARLIGSLAFVWVALEGGVCSSINPVPCKQVRPSVGSSRAGRQADNGSSSFLGVRLLLVISDT